MQLRRQETINDSQRHNWNGQDDIFHDIAVREFDMIRIGTTRNRGIETISGDEMLTFLFNRKAKRATQLNRNFIGFCVPNYFKLRWLRWYKYIFPRWNSCTYLHMFAAHNVKNPILPVVEEMIVRSFLFKGFFFLPSFTSILRKNTK